MSLTSERLAQLSETKRALLEKRLRGEKGAQAARPVILRDPRRGAAPLSFAQERAWFFEQLEPGSPMYNLPLAMRIEGELRAGLLEALFGEIARRHEALRTVIVMRDGEPLQEVLPALPGALPVVDLEALSAEAREPVIRELAAEEALRPFDLARGPMLRTCLLRLGEREHVMLLTMHHIASDGWSTGVLIHEVGVLYDAYLRRRPSPLPELPVQYADYAVWQREWLRGEVLEQQIGYWRAQLAGADEVLDLPTDHPRGALPTFRGQARQIALPASLSTRLRALMRAENATPFMLFLAAWQALLCRYTGREDVSVGTPIAGRNRREIEGLIGFFVNTLVLRTVLAGNPSFRELLGRVRQVALDAYSHQDLPFEKLVEELRPERSLSHTPLFQVMFVLQNAPSDEVDLQGLRLEPLETGAVTAEHDWTLEITEEGETFIASLQYRADLFEGETAERALSHLGVLLEKAALEPWVSLADLPLIAEAERHQLLCAWSGAGAAAEGTVVARPVHELVAERAALSPEAPAILWEGSALSFRELDERANRLARELRRIGIGPESLVALCLERSPEMAVALLGVLKAGGAFLPLDPAHPEERLAFFLEDSGATVVLTQERLAGRIPAGVESLRLDTDRERIDRHPPAPPEDRTPPESPAYVIYTSGSTGRPKGTVIPRGALDGYTAAIAGVLGLVPGDRVLQFASLSFDVAIEEILPTWASGGAVALRPAEAVATPEGLLRALAEDAVTVCNLPTAFWHEWVWFLESSGAALPAALRLVVIGGEAVLPERLAFWRTLGVPLLHGYGLTEATVTSTLFRGGAEGAHAGLSLPIGRPLAGTEVFVADRQLLPAPLGVPGELCVAGDGLARGYLHRPGLTAERFVPHPWSARPGARIYRTGDRVRFLGDGNLEFLGRLDFQLKIRGYRVEPGEIEVELGRHPAVREAVVVPRPAADGSRRLVAYAALHGESGAGADELRRHLRERLPDYMVPGAFVLLEALPRTTAGKVDRAALPEPGGVEEEPAAAGPRSQTEELLAALWSQVLGVAAVRPRDDFFALGGHSLLGTRLMSRVREVFGVEVPLRALFEQPTLSGLAGEIEEVLRSGEAARRPPVERVPREGDLPLSFAQRRLWFIDQIEPGNAAYNMPAALRIEGGLDFFAFERTLTEIVRRHEVLRTRFPVPEGEPAQRIDPPTPFPVPRIDLRGLDGAARERESLRLAAEEAQTPFDLENGPMLRARVLLLGAGDNALLFTLHHIVSDAWSLEVMVREIAALYVAFAAGQPSPLPELPLQYADFAAWQRRWLQGEELETQLAYWKQQLAGVSYVLNLPTDRPRPPVQSFRGSGHLFELTPALSERLRALSRREGVTLFMTCLAAFQVLLARAAGQDDFCVGTPVAGRNQVETEDLIGFFINTLALRADLRGAGSFRDHLRRVREVCLGAFSHQDFPLEKLVEELQPERDLSRQPLFQVVFALEHEMGGEAVDLPGLSLTPLEHGGSTAKFDLTLTVTETGEGLQGGLDFCADLFEQTTVARLAGHLEALLGAMAEDAATGLDVDLLTAAERQQLLVEWNDTRTSSVWALVHRLVEEQADRAPDRPAVVGEGGSLTYGELDRRANQLAHRLRALGVGPEVVVGVWLERSPDMVMAQLAILKAGGAYLPLDVRHPRERVAYMLEDAGVLLALSTGALAESFPASAFERGAQLVLLDQGTFDGESTARPEAAVLPENLAYVIYTSGSTGRPKGTQLAHAGLVNLVRWHLREHAVTAADRATQVASPAFDAAVWEVWPYLAAGASLHLPGEEVRSAPAALLDWLGEREISLSFLPTPLAEALLDLPPRPLPLRALLVGGDRLRRPPRRELGFRLVNHYGPTESTVVATWADVPPGGDEEDASPPIGRPLDNLRVHLLDRALRPVPVGVAGELLVGGDGLARGYLGRAALTAERFIPDPLAGADETGARLYRTGDLGRRLADGRIEFLGRIDHQVKLRGVRIELGEIEAVLLQHAAVKEAVVVVREDQPGDRRLVAYVVPTPESKFPWLRQLGPDGKIPLFRPIVSRRKVRARWNNSGGEVAETWPQATPSELRAFLEERLPEAMVPAAFVTSLEALPLTPTGKVDRAALPAPTEADAAGTRKYMAPRTVTEELLAGIFSELIGVKRVGIHDNFFELGGHSLLATLASTRIRKLFNLVNLPLRKLFENPTVAEMATVIEQSRREQRGLTISPIERVPRTGPLPVSFAQQRLWFLDRLQPGSSAYNIPQGMRMGGLIDVGALRASLREVVHRHEALRTTFAEIEGEPVQVISPEVSLELPVVDLGALPEDLRERESQRFAQEELDRPFDLQAGPLLRTRLLRFADKDHMVLLTMHHIVSDGWSMGILIREMGQLYEAFSHGKPSPLPELPVQYADFAVWQRGWLQGAVLEEQLSFWRKQVEGAPPVLELPTDRPRPEVQTTRGALQMCRLPPALSAAVKAMGPREGATLFMTLLAGFQALLGHYARRTDVLIGSPSAGRNQLETEDLIGFFVNTIVLRTDLSGDPSSRELIQRVREVVLQAYAHQDLPFERLVEEVRPQRSLSHEPVYQVLLVLQNSLRQGGERLPGVKLQPLGIRRVRSQRDLTLEVQEGQESLQLSVEYNVDLFDHTRMTRLLGHLEMLLEGMSAFPERPLSTLPLLSEPEVHQISREWNDTAAGGVDERTLGELFAARVALSPDALAVVQGTGQDAARLTYRELDGQARRLAALLRGCGVGPEVPVALCTERSAESIIGILGILHAGGAWVPLDPGNPAERQGQVLADLRPPVLLTQRRLVAGLERHGVPLICLDEELPTEAAAPDAQAAAAPDNLAYVIYTSGSTGRPKGVGVSHRAAAGHFATIRRELGLEPRDRVLQFSSLAFDVSVQEILPTLLCGAALVLRDETVGTVGEMVAWVARQEISVLSLPTAYWNLLAQAGAQVADAPAPERLRVAVVAGEAMLPEPLRVWRRSPWASVRLINGYGPTEATILSTIADVGGAADGSMSAAVPIGRPLANRFHQIVDPAFRPVPCGVPGELCLGGEGLARGYVGRPAETAEKFVPDPFSGTPGARLYTTGDLARTLADGRVEFLGRIDQQLKIRGFRVEPGEVEAALLELPAVRECAVVAREIAGSLRLVAYVVGAEEGVAAEPLRELLRRRLPDYMVPAHFERLEALPRTATGKVDRRALPEPGLEGQEGGGHLAPRDEVERQLVALWEDILGVRPVGVRDDFFHLGGHSLLAVRLLSRLESATGKRIPMAALFQGATVERLAALVRGEELKGRGASLVPIQTRGSRPPMFWVHPAGGNVVCYAPLSRTLGDDFPFYGLQAQGLDGEEAPFTSIGDMAAHYVSEIETVQPEGPYHLGGWSLGGVVAFEMARQLRARGREVRLLALIDVRAPELEDRLAARDPLALLRNFALDFGLPTDFALGGDPLDVNLDRQLGAILERAHKEGLLAPEIGLPQVARYFEIFRANFRALSQYRPDRLPGALSLLKASQPLQRIPLRPEASWLERTIRRTHLALDTAWTKAWSRWLQPTLGWRPLVEGEIEVRTLEGTHYTLLRQPDVQALADWLRQALPEKQGPEE